MKGIEPPTPSLPWKCSTPELHRQMRNRPHGKKSYSKIVDSPDKPEGPLSGRRDSNPRPSAWKADALPTELRPHQLYYQKARRSEK